jgi:glycosyltransferase involved in cell wall biosynthesis
MRKILIDGRPLYSGNSTRGIGRFAKGLIQAVAETNSKFELCLLVPSFVKENQLFGLEIRRIACWPNYKDMYLFSHQFQIPFILKSENFDLFHSFEPTSVCVAPSKRVMMVYDTIKFSLADQYPQGARGKILQKIERVAIVGADEIITISNSAKEDIAKYHHIDTRKISVVYGAVGADFKPVLSSLEEEQLLAKHGITNQYLVYVGSFQNPDPRKNIPLLLEVFQRLVQTYDNPLQLVFVGKTGQYSEYLTDRIESLGLTANVVFTGFVPDSELVSLLTKAQCLVFPSSYEGFGLPLVEAMACGTPVVSLANTSIREVVGSAGILVATNDKEQFYRATLDVLSNSSLRSRLKRSGLSQAARFSWEESAKKVLQIYERILE